MRNLVGQVASDLVSDRVRNSSGEISLFQVTRIYDKDVIARWLFVED